MIRRCLALVALLLCSVGVACAQSYPSRPVRLIVPSPAGSALDQFGRALAEQLAARWNTSVVVESKPGGAGMIAAAAVVGAPADGYTLFLPNEQVLVNNRFSYRKLSYDPDRSFVPISILVQADQMFFANTEVPFKDFAGMVAYAKANPQKLTYGMWSPGSSPHLSFESLKQSTGAQIVGVSYKGVGPVQIAMQANEVQLTVMSAPTAAPLVQAGKAVPLAVASKTRSALHPNVPTTAELGFPGIIAATWYALMAPAGTPPEIVAKIEKDARDVIRDPQFFERYQAFKGWNVVASSAAEMTATVASQIAIVGDMMKTAGVKPE